MEFGRFGQRPRASQYQFVLASPEALAAPAPIEFGAAIISETLTTRLARLSNKKSLAP